MSITIVGLGPGNPAHLTLEAWRILQEADEVYLRTDRHPTVSSLPSHLSLHSFDHLYEEKDDFTAVYEAIAAQVLALGRRPQGVIYAVPGHPLVGEASVQRILVLAEEEGLKVHLVEGLSFIEPVLTCLGLDALDGLQIADATELAARCHPPLNPDVPTLVGQLYGRRLASGVKLTLMNLLPDDHPLTLVRGAGTESVVVKTLPLYQLDRSDDIDHLTTLYIPPLPQPGSIETFQDTVARLRAPDGCPWDREQTHRSLRSCLLEETYEVLEALDNDDPVKLREELGDLLMQIVLHTQMAIEAGDFDLAQVVRSIDTKIKRRHPHVFGQAVVSDSAQVLHNWEEIKRGERGDEDHRSILDNVPKALPALAQADAYQRRVARVGFDWPDIEGVMAKVAEEVRELRGAADNREGERELGDLLFSIVNLARWLEIDAESALRAANARFARRFVRMEHLCQARGQRLADLPLAEQDKLWEEVKEHEEI
ncbi:MAG: nucleoside triphosphate pyrophosphohydrolase [Anaerolineae bacterium]